MKTCKVCELHLKNDSFWKDNRSKDGLQYRCIQCFLKYKNENRDKINKQAKIYRKENKKRISQYFKNRLKNDPIYRMKKNLRTRIGLALKTNQKTGTLLYEKE